MHKLVKGKQKEEEVCEPYIKKDGLTSAPKRK